MVESSHGSITDKISSLAASIVDRKNSSVDPYVIFLGAGASISSGCSGMPKIIDDTLELREPQKFKAWQEKIIEATKINRKFGDLLKKDILKEKCVIFFELWDKLDNDTKYSILRPHLGENKEPSSGYHDLAFLIKEGYFKVILSTNLDSMLEKALIRIGVLQPENFITIINNKDRIEEIKTQLERSYSSIKLVKLHGSLESPKSYSFSPKEICDFEKTIKPTLSKIVNQSLIIIGYSLQDRDTDLLFEEQGDEIHYINKNEPEIGGRMDTILRVREQGSMITGENGTFDNFMHMLRDCVEQFANKKNTSCSGKSIEAFIQSIGYEHELLSPRSRYKNLPSLYVKPREYEEICQKLEKEHIIFIIGEPHLGKTYTAFHILWEYFQIDYDVMHIRHDYLVNLIHKHNGDMKELLLTLFSSEQNKCRIIHFDDPFGETMERRTDAFAKSLDDFLEIANSYEHLRVIITTRLNIFNQSVAGMPYFQKLQKLERDIRVHTSYSPNILLEVLHRYIAFYKPVWGGNEKIMATLDERLPELLPAPHNIEFFVRTSIKLTTIDDVLKHVDSCKEMVGALGQWMANLSDHEQIFLTWVEICATAGMLFPGTSASRINIEKVYDNTLIYCYRKNLIPCIPTNIFGLCRDKFDTILLEQSQKGFTRRKKVDFVHPSYHEAFWYAMKTNGHFHSWWEVIKNRLGTILLGSRKKIDFVQLVMVERYGTVNRNLDQLLLLSALSSNPDEQTIALEHMLERLDSFKALPQFLHCWNSLANSEYERHAYTLLGFTDKYFEGLPTIFQKTAVDLNFSQYSRLRVTAFKLLDKKLDIFPTEIKDSKEFKKIQAVHRLLNKFQPIFHQLSGIKNDDAFTQLQYYFDVCGRILYTQLRGEHEMQMAGRNNPVTERKLITQVIESINEEDFTLLLDTNLNLPFQNYDDLSRDYDEIRHLRYLYRSSGYLSNPSNSICFNALFMWILLTDLNELSAPKKTVVYSLLNDAEFVKYLRGILNEGLRNKITPTVLYILLEVPDVIVKRDALYFVLTEMSYAARHDIDKIMPLITNPPGSWVGAAAGKSALRFDNDKKNSIAFDSDWYTTRILLTGDILVIGAMVGEMAIGALYQGNQAQVLLKKILSKCNGDIIRPAMAWLIEAYPQLIDNKKITEEIKSIIKCTLPKI